MVLLKYGHHVNLVSQGVCPRYAYTIGLTGSLGVDFLLPGASYYMENDIFLIIEYFVKNAKIGSMDQKKFDVDGFGPFSLRRCDASWVGKLAHGAMAVYDQVTPFIQICPDGDSLTIDTPDLSKLFNSSEQPVWQWLTEPWNYLVPSNSTATTNLSALRGMRVTEAARWAEDEWEFFAGSGSETPDKDIRVMPLSTFLGHDPSIDHVVALEIGKAAWRDADEVCWHDWEAAK